MKKISLLISMPIFLLLSSAINAGQVAYVGIVGVNDADGVWQSIVYKADNAWSNGWTWNNGISNAMVEAYTSGASVTIIKNNSTQEITGINFSLQ